MQPEVVNHLEKKISQENDGEENKTQAGNVFSTAQLQKGTYFCLPLCRHDVANVLHYDRQTICNVLLEREVICIFMNFLL